MTTTMVVDDDTAMVLDDDDDGIDDYERGADEDDWRQLP